ncbi:hypothetical protein K0M31_010342 [Melipona bicolor]|uniref:Uncharacterized protein n=1 Tax=Melipona bicolor TaxID=60889 RepID=A0AA40FMM4_9HYME|nr:hypothetical protein K0M31_010342 [Melipona bicolor]
MNSPKFTVTCDKSKNSLKGAERTANCRLKTRTSNNGKDVCLMVGKVRKQRRVATSSPRTFALQIHRRRRPWSFKPSAVPAGVYQPRIQPKTKCTLTK